MRLLDPFSGRLVPGRPVSSFISLTTTAAAPTSGPPTPAGLEGHVRAQRGLPLSTPRFSLSAPRSCPRRQRRGTIVPTVPEGRVTLRAVFIGYRSVEVRRSRFPRGRTVSRTSSSSSLDAPGESRSEGRGRGSLPQS